ncbi:MAG: aldehyde dehydrogenase family protein [Gammaproteobacteria bacterium]|nr:aldehyde dehydrogenase family protein [Gammaproteobacteria bacterium]
MAFRLTYSTMFDPPQELHERFDSALAGVRSKLGQTWRHYIGGQDVAGHGLVEKRSPIDADLVLGRFPAGTAADAAAALAAARAAFPAWRATPVAERNRILRRVAEVIDNRVYDISAAVALEVGKNRMEALGEVQETADFFRIYCDLFEREDNFNRPLPDDPLPGFRSRNRSMMKPYGPWVVITPFNFPFALAGGPVAAALVTGNTVVLKGASDTPWSGRLLADCLHEAGVPSGAFNYLTGPGRIVGEALLDNADTAGVTFTGSHEVGMGIVRHFAAGRYVRPCIAEMGGKNAVIVARGADLDRAALGILRSAFGMGGQKCSALSRIYVEEAVADDLIGRLVKVIGEIRIGDPTRRENWLGPVINERAYAEFQFRVAELADDGAVLHTGGKILTGGNLARGYYCAPTLAEAPLSHLQWRQELFLPIVLLARVPDKETAMQLANDCDLGLTAGFYGAQEDVDWFLDRIQAGVTYVNRPQGATTGAWPGYQPFGGWKGSGNTGKAIASFYYLAQYMREQSQTIVD